MDHVAIDLHSNVILREEALDLDRTSSMGKEIFLGEMGGQ